MTGRRYATPVAEDGRANTGEGNIGVLGSRISVRNLDVSNKLDIGAKRVEGGGDDNDVDRCNRCEVKYAHAGQRAMPSRSRWCSGL